MVRRHMRRRSMDTKDVRQYGCSTVRQFSEQMGQIELSKRQAIERLFLREQPNSRTPEQPDALLGMTDGF